MPDPTTPNQPVPTTELALTPNGTPVVPTQLSPEMVTLLNAAIATLPPGAGKAILKQNWGYVIALVIPLLLTVWTNLKQIWEGPAMITAIRQEYEADHQAIDALETKVEELEKKLGGLETKLDQVLWILKREDGGLKNRQ